MNFRKKRMLAFTYITRNTASDASIGHVPECAGWSYGWLQTLLRRNALTLVNISFSILYSFVLLLCFPIEDVPALSNDALTM